ncbi:MAG: CpaD family pilus assembly protein [Pseudomonadota bacterium]
MSVIKSQKTLASRRPSSARVAATAVTLLAVGLVGCRGHMAGYSENRGTVIADASARHPIAVSKAPVQMDIEVPRGSSGLTVSQASRLKGFIARYRQEGEGQIIVSAPSGGSNEYAVVNTVSDVRNTIHGVGISGHAVSMEPYYVSSHSMAPIKVSFTTLVAKGPECGEWKENLGDTHRNTSYGNFGCAQQKNLAAMVANPRDLISPRGLDPRDGARRDATFDRFVDGQSTGAQKSQDERQGTVSKVAR